MTATPTGRHHIRAVREVERSMIWCTDEEADCFGLYRDLDDGTCIWVADFAERRDAEQARAALDSELVLQERLRAAKVTITHQHGRFRWSVANPLGCRSLTGIASSITEAEADARRALEQCHGYGMHLIQQGLQASS